MLPLSVILDPELSAADGGKFIQTVRLAAPGGSIGIARWHTSASPKEGVIQILEFEIEPPYRRQGYGGRLLKELVAQASAYFKQRRCKLRRVWLSVEQKNQVIARAFLTSQGFHHVGTTKELFRDQDQLIYSKAFD